MLAWATRSCRPRSASLDPSAESAGLAALPPAALPDPSSESAGLAGLAHVTACNGRIFGVCGPTWARRALAGLALQCLEPSTVGPGLAGLALTAPKNRGPGRCAALLPALARPRAPPPPKPPSNANKIRPLLPVSRGAFEYASYVASKLSLDPPTLSSLTRGSWSGCATQQRIWAVDLCIGNGGSASNFSVGLRARGKRPQLPSTSLFDVAWF